jgi:transaldolase
MNERVQRLREAGVSIWLDTLSRALLETGEFERLIGDLGVSGATSNPTIFAKAITGSDRYDDQLRALVQTGITDPQELFFSIGLDDVRSAADLLRATYDGSGGTDGFVSFECTPDLADETEATIEQALELWARLERPNVMIKVPATAAGVPAIEELTASGVNVNVTLLFSVERYEQVIEAYLSGLERRAKSGKPLEGIASVASFFVSRVDTKASGHLPLASPLRGRIAIANAHRAYGRYLRHFGDDRWRALMEYARGRRGPCGRAQAPRIPPTPMFST